MKTKKTEFEKSLKVVTETIKKDKDLYYGYQSNIAMSFYDAVKNFGVVIPHSELVKVSNHAAKSFLNTWIG